MISAKGNSGREKAPTPKQVTVFKGIKGLVASGPGMTKTPNVPKLRPENKTAHIDAGNLKHASGTSKAAAGSPKAITKGSVRVTPKIRPEGGIARDAARVIKP
jgi:hypothetical protein